MVLIWSLTQTGGDQDAIHCELKTTLVPTTAGKKDKLQVNKNNFQDNYMRSIQKEIVYCLFRDSTPGKFSVVQTM